MKNSCAVPKKKRLPKTEAFSQTMNMYCQISARMDAMIFLMPLFCSE